MRELPLATGAAAAGVESRRARDVAVSAVFVASGFVAFLVAAALLLAWGGDIAAPGGWASPHALALTHVLALGFVSSVAIGVLYHIAPLALGRPVPLPVAGVGIWVVYVAGAAALIAGLATFRTAVIAAGGALLACAIAAIAVQLGFVVAGARRRFLPAVYQVMAVVALIVVVGLGTTLALMLHLGAGASVSTLLGVKVLVAIGGWLGVLVTGVSYQLVPMFTPTTARSRSAKAVLWLLIVGVLVAVVVVISGAPAWVRALSGLVYLAGVVLHVGDVARLMRARRGRSMSAVSSGQALGAVLLAAGAAEGTVALTGAMPWPQLAVVTALIGWAPVLIAANGVRIVPFILWQGMPPGRRPRTFAAAPAPLGWTGIVAATSAWALMTAAMSADNAVCARLAGVALLACALAVAGIGVTSLRDARRLRAAAMP